MLREKERRFSENTAFRGTAGYRSSPAVEGETNRELYNKSCAISNVGGGQRVRQGG